MEWFSLLRDWKLSKPAKAPKAIAPPTPVVPTITAPQETTMANEFVSIMDWIGKEEKLVYADIVKYAPPVAKVAELLFPAEATAIAAGETTVVDATTLIQNSVLMVEQKYAASGVATGTGEQKAAEVLTLAGSAVTSLLSKAGIVATASYIQSLIAAVVGVLNFQSAPATAAPAAA